MNAFNRILAALAFAALTLSPVAFAGKAVNINAASASELADSLDGIGDAKAQAIVAYRKANNVRCSSRCTRLPCASAGAPLPP